MKTFYTLEHAHSAIASVTTAAGSRSRGIGLKTVLLLLSMLLTLDGFCQSIYSSGTGDWNAPSTWFVLGNGSNMTPAGRIPNSSDVVEITNGSYVTISSGAFTCSVVNIAAGTGNNKAGGVLVIGTTGAASLNLSNLQFGTANGTPKERASLLIGDNGYLGITGAVSKSSANGDIFYRFSPTSTIDYKGAAQTLFNFIAVAGATEAETATTYGNLTLSGSGTKTPAAALGIRGNLKVNAGSTLSAGTFTHTVTGNVDNAGSITASSSTLNIAGNFSNTGTFSAGTGTVNYNGSNQTVANVTYNNLTFSGSGTKTAAGNIAVGNAVSVSGVTFAPQTFTFTYNGNVAQTIAALPYYNLTLSGSGAKTGPASLTVTNNLSNSTTLNAGTGTLQIGRDFSNTSTGTFNAGTGTVNYNGNSGTASQSVAGVTYNQLQFSGASVKTAAAALQTNGNLLINAGSNFSAAAFSHTVAGNWTNNGTFNAGTSLVLLNGAAKTISSSNTGAFNNLSVSNGTSTLATAVTVNGALRVTGTILQTGANTLYLGAAGNLLSAETSTEHVQGTIQATRDLITSEGQTFGNIGVRLTSNPANISNVTVKRVTGSPFLSAGNESVSRQFYITTSDASAAGLGTAALEMRFPSYDLDGGVGTVTYDIYRQDLNGVMAKLPAASATDPANYNYKLASAEKFGMYTLSSVMSPLPVELIWFRVQPQAQGALLTWETASEKDNKGFEVQVSTNGRHFAKVGFVSSYTGTSSVAKQYSYTDHAAAGTRYYRLAQIDLDGTTTYSAIKALTLGNAPVAANAYPNPFAAGQRVAVQLASVERREVRLVLTNALGQVLAEQEVQVQPGMSEVAVDMAAAQAKGLYLLTITDKGSTQTLKLLKR